ncbi:MAG: glucosaminidase domain-containing protein [Veillonellaceae bacterium]|uniref:glucosaminidase domain-containing protein n=1 Tax=Anaerovibrio lipolyticus TaxID=82374 RepID=UPI003AF31CCA|nr:glucosaminidase domain-containing protein [Veillonellaceae bacterium]MCI7235655.1 glucosaminidase domain-containing protein [Veillonellaceae bacterium]MDD6563332.1 glucosaminidase domain-containing protein [Veillonellaceae bacterium]MDD7656788.1 glucosaminidase domain-containing protein [Veillonellaceae bacterium]
MKTKKILSIAACGLSLLLFSGAVNVEASIAIKDGSKTRTVVKVNRQQSQTAQHNTIAKKVKKAQKAEAGQQVEAMDSERELSFQERIYQILHPREAEPDKKAAIASRDDNMIMGGAVATQEQCVRYLLKHNPNPKLNVSPQELVSYYYEEGSRTGIRPDIAFAQALKETGYFRYGGTVIPAQNNYCGLGTTSATVQGAYFATPRLGVKAHIQHLLAYASVEPPQDNIVDPRYELVRRSYGSNTLTQWKDLNGRWAVPGVGYGQSILEDYYQGILNS